MVTRDWQAELTALFPTGEVTRGADGFMWVKVDKERLRDAVNGLKGLGITNLSTIIAEDMREHFLLSYPFLGGTVVTLLVKIDKDKPEVPTLADTVAGAIVYEREIHDIMGITPVGHPDLRRQVLPEDWPEGVYPLRKDVVMPPASVAKQGGDK
jgi:Ni,Fe-hydrogenase III component G